MLKSELQDVDNNNYNENKMYNIELKIIIN